MDDWMDAYRVGYEVSLREEKEWHDAWMDAIAKAEENTQWQ
jgi:hypothetical protein